MCVFQVWAAVPPWKQGALSEFVVVSGNEVIHQFCAEMPLESTRLTNISEIIVGFFFRSGSCLMGRF